MTSVAEWTSGPTGLTDQTIFLINGAIARDASHVLTAQEYFGGAELGSLVGRQLVVSTPTTAPPWLDPVVQRVAALLTLAPNWDSYGALPIDPDLGIAAILLLAHTMYDQTPTPNVVPTNRGGIQLEWHVHDIDLEVEILSPSRFDVFFQDDRRGIDWDGELAADLRPLTNALDELTRRALAAR